MYIRHNKWTFVITFHRTIGTTGKMENFNCKLLQLVSAVPWVLILLHLQYRISTASFEIYISARLMHLRRL